MKINFRTNKLAKIFNSEKELVKCYGPVQTRKIKTRMAVLRAASNLAEVPSVKPERCHPLTGDRLGQYAVDLEHPFRLVFRPEEPVALLADGGVDLTKVSGIVILKVEDYHGN